MFIERITHFLAILLIGGGSLLAQGLPSDAALLSVADVPTLREDLPAAAPLSAQSEVYQQLAEHLAVLHQQVEQLTALQDALDQEYLRLHRLRQASQAEIEALQRAADATEATDPSAAPPHRAEILLLEQQVSETERQLQQNETRRRLYQQMAESLEGQIAEHEELQLIWQQMKEADGIAVSP